MSREGYDFDKIRAADRRAGTARIAMADEIGWLYLKDRTYGALNAACFEKVSDVRERLAAGTLADLPGIGPARVLAIAEAVAYYDNRQLPADDPNLKAIGAVYGLVDGAQRLVAAGQLLAAPGLADEEFTDALAAFHADVLGPKIRALIDTADGDSPVTREEGRSLIAEAVRLLDQQAAPMSAPTGGAA